MKFGPRSVAFRVVALSTLWAVIALVATATVISALYSRSNRHAFDSLLSAHLFNLIGSVSVSPSGVLSGNPDLGDLRFTIPDSGWYWEVMPVSLGLTGDLRSPSMTGAIPSPSPAKAPFGPEFRRRYLSSGPDGETVLVLESEVVLDKANRIARFRVMGNVSDLRRATARFDQRLYFYLAVFGFGMIAINALAIILGLRPLDRVRLALAAIREGSAQRLEGRFPAEIGPLVRETNALIENNRRILERSRTQVGNLAHSLKTPIAVLLNEGRAIGGARGRLIADQAAAMQRQVDYYLQRARIAAQRETVVFRTPVAPLVERLVRVMAKLNPDRRVSLTGSPVDCRFRGEEGDFEEIVGNLLDNAVKWSETEVTVSVRATGSDRFELVIEDDGPGIPAELAKEVLKRGRRLDESKPGSGLGLSIVAELVAEYGGSLSLERSELGGLRAVVALPRSV